MPLIKGNFNETQQCDPSPKINEIIASTEPSRPTAQLTSTDTF
uniref:Uncharacterized protein n=1 Tax=Anguilla anguilla TaxID=7936 RepID=A0A0E9VJ84_ANGAN